MKNLSSLLVFRIWFDAIIVLTQMVFKVKIRVMSYLDLEDKLTQIIQSYNANKYLIEMKKLLEYNLSERDFAQIIGKGSLYNYSPQKGKILITRIAS